VELRSGRKWSESYLALTSSFLLQLSPGEGGVLAGRPTALVNWVTTQSVPSPLPPYAAGSPRSRILDLLDGGHGGVRLGREEIETIACWIDLGIPFCGDYTEANAWPEAELRKHERFAAKRRAAEAEEQRGIEALRSEARPPESAGVETSQ
jgi:hypothetical protein